MPKLFQRLGGRRPKPSEITIDHLHLLISQAVSQENLSRDAGHMMQRILALGDTPLSAVMVPKAQAIGVQASAKMPQIIEAFLKSGHSRLPVYEDSFDNVIGIIHVKELLRFWHRSARNLRAVEFIRLPNFFPQTMKVAQALSEFRRKRISVGIVIDEYGIPAGLVTTEDLIEEIVGEIADELDHEFRHHRLLGDGSYIIEASMPVEKFAEIFGCRPRPGSHSVGGMVLESLQRIPREGETFQLCNLQWEVVEATATKLIKLKATLPKK